MKNQENDADAGNAAEADTLAGAAATDAVAVELSPVDALLARIAAHDSEGELIAAEMTRLGLDAKKLKAIGKARAAQDAAKKTLDALLSGGLV